MSLVSSLILKLRLDVSWVMVARVDSHQTFSAHKVATVASAGVSQLGGDSVGGEFSQEWSVSRNIAYIIHTGRGNNARWDKGKESKDKCSSDNINVSPSIP